MDFRPLATEEREGLIKALRSNIEGQTIFMNKRDTSFIGTTDDVSDNEVVAAIRSVPCHY